MYITKSTDHRIAENPVFALIDRRQRVHHDEESEQQGDEISVRDEPALVVVMLFRTLAAGHTLENVALKAAFNNAWIIAISDTDQPINDHFTLHDQAIDIRLELVGHRQENQIS